MLAFYEVIRLRVPLGWNRVPTAVEQALHILLYLLSTYPSELVSEYELWEVVPYF